VRLGEIDSPGFEEFNYPLEMDGRFWEREEG